MFKLTDDRSKKGTPLAKVVMQTLSNLMNTDDKLVFLEADLAGASSSISLIIIGSEQMSTLSYPFIQSPQCCTELPDRRNS